MSKKGFTLIELIIVMVIISLLALIALMYLRGQLFKGNDARRKSDLDRIKIAAEEYEKDHNCYPPPDLMYCNVPPFNGTGLKPYLDKIPCDPVTNVTYFYEYDNASTCSTWFRIYTKLDNTADTGIMAVCGGPENNSFNYYVQSTNAPKCESNGQDNGSSGDGNNPPASSPPVAPNTYYGCFSGVCKQISWNYNLNAPECDPHFSDNNCLMRCVDDITGGPINECNKL